MKFFLNLFTFLVNNTPITHIHAVITIQYLNNNTCINLYESLESRLASFILKSENNGIFSYNLTECAELLCTSYRHLLRIINLFCNTNKLSKNGKSYKIIDRGYLESIASNSIIT